MSQLLIVTTFRSGDIHLLKKKIEWYKHVDFKATHDLLLIGDGSTTSEQVEEVSKLNSPYFSKIITRKFNEFPTKNEWPYNVNNAWRITAKIIYGMYGDKVDVSPYVGWFYFEPDVTLLNKDAFTILEQNYKLLKKPLMGKINETRTNEDRVIVHMNGAGIYPTQFSQAIKPSAFIIDNIPWDVAALQLPSPYIAEIPKSVYEMGFGTTNFRLDGDLLLAEQTIGKEVLEYSFQIKEQLLHHGCKDGSLIDILINPSEKKEYNPKSVNDVVLESVNEPTDDDKIKNRIVEDFKSGVPYRMILKRNRRSAKFISSVLKEHGLK